ncbi:hypothetical protein NDU88_005686 [Pleurodeles waltl]|uniref:Uncharacterized protein n=1 Tax=Pleurodeles waltl TaxID=8319 RepID=A0AAV7N035_PLEWA|nr:hypothetical protein NDU88_005686 [Pleurodeles waltl]
MQQRPGGGEWRGRAHLHRGPLPIPRAAAATTFTLAEGRREASCDGRSQTLPLLHLGDLRSKRVFAPARAKTKLQGALQLLQQGSGIRRSPQPGHRGEGRSAREPPLRYKLHDQGGRLHSLAPYLDSGPSGILSWRGPRRPRLCHAAQSEPRRLARQPLHSPHLSLHRRRRARSAPEGRRVFAPASHTFALRTTARERLQDIFM